MKVAQYFSAARLPDGRRIEIRALNPSDRSGFVEAIDRMSAGSLYRRFFSLKRDFTSREVARFLNVDFVTEVALVAIVKEAGCPAIVGAGRYIITQPGRAEVAFAVVDQYQGHGIGKLLMHHLATIARESGVDEFLAEVLPDNMAMLKVFAKSGFGVNTARDSSVVNVIIDLRAGGAV